MRMTAPKQPTKTRAQVVAANSDHLHARLDDVLRAMSRGGSDREALENLMVALTRTRDAAREAGAATKEKR